MKRLLFFLLSFFIVIGNMNFVYVAEIPEKIRVGLESRYKSVDSIKIGNKKIRLGFNENFSDYIFEAKNYFTVSLAEKFYIDTEKSYCAYKDALIAKNNYLKNGYKALISFVGTDCWSVYIGGFDNFKDAETANFKLCAKIIASDRKKLLLSADESPLIIFENNLLCPQFKSDEYMNLGDRKYRGVIEFGFYDMSKITAVNILSLDEYLYGVVPSEMPSDWHEEAIKAQIIAARTYAVKNLNSHKYCDLCDSVHCQMYLGVNNESARINKIVEQTKNVCIYYNNKPINAVFFSNSGGFTEYAENVWNNKFEYLKSVPEMNETTKVWTRKFKCSEIKKIFDDKKIDIGDILGIQILDRLPSGRVSELSIIGTAGEKKLCKEEIRNFFAKTQGGILQSRIFDITIQIPELIGSASCQDWDCTIKFSGRGWGHGVGMSQWGAKGMAELGFKFDDILKYYYTGVEIK